MPFPERQKISAQETARRRYTLPAGVSAETPAGKLPAIFQLLDRRNRLRCGLSFPGPGPHSFDRPALGEPGDAKRENRSCLEAGYTAKRAGGTGEPAPRRPCADLGIQGVTIGWCCRSPLRPAPPTSPGWPRTGSTCWSSGAGSPAPASPWTPRRAACRWPWWRRTTSRPGPRGALPGWCTAACATWSTASSAWSGSRCGSGASCSGWRRTWSGRYRCTCWPTTCAAGPRTGSG